MNLLLLSLSQHVLGISGKPFLEGTHLAWSETLFGLDILCYYQMHTVSLPFCITSNSVSSGISLKALRGF